MALDLLCKAKALRDAANAALADVKLTPETKVTTVEQLNTQLRELFAFERKVLYVQVGTTNHWTGCEVRKDDFNALPKEFNKHPALPAIQYCICDPTMRFYMGFETFLEIIASASTCYEYKKCDRPAAIPAWS